MPYTNPNSEPVMPVDPLPVASLLATPLLLVAFFAALSYPLYALSAAVAVLAGAKLLQYGLATLVARGRDRVREFALPGVGTVRFRITPR